MSKKSILSLYTKKELQCIVNKSNSYSDVCRFIGITITGYQYKQLKKVLKKFNINIDHFDKSKYHQFIEIPLRNILVEHSVYCRKNLKKRLINNNLLENKCNNCGLSNEWNNKPLILQLDHINGISDDNRLENLRLLCPNCHSQTDTFSGRKTRNKCIVCGSYISNRSKNNLCHKCFNHSRKKQQPDIDILEEQVNRLGVVKTSKIYGVTHTTIRRWLLSSKNGRDGEI